MQRFNTLFISLAVALASGCSATPDDGDGAGHNDELRGFHHRGSASTTGGASGTGTTTSCSLCATTQACCNAVNAGALCTFSAETCSELDAGRQKTYANYCLVTLRTIISAWQLHGDTPPAVCRLP